MAARSPGVCKTASGPMWKLEVRTDDTEIHWPIGVVDENKEVLGQGATRIGTAEILANHWRPTGGGESGKVKRVKSAR